MDTAPFTLEITQDAPAVFHAPSCSVSSCDGCYKRPGKLTHQFAHGPCGHHGEVPRFVFRSHHCQWCLAAENRRLKREGKPLWSYLEWMPDAEILSQNAESIHPESKA